MTVTKLLHTRLRVNDIEQSVKFYEQALGLIATRRHTSPRGAQLVFLATPNSDEELEFRVEVDLILSYRHNVASTVFDEFFLVKRI